MPKLSSIAFGCWCLHALPELDSGFETLPPRKNYVTKSVTFVEINMREGEVKSLVGYWPEFIIYLVFLFFSLASAAT